MLLINLDWHRLGERVSSDMLNMHILTCCSVHVEDSSTYTGTLHGTVDHGMEYSMRPWNIACDSKCSASVGHSCDS